MNWPHALHTLHQMLVNLCPSCVDMKRILCLFLFVVLTAASAFDTCAQEIDNDSSAFRLHLDEAKQFSTVSRYGDSIDELQQARALAKESNRDDWYTEATIQLAEVPSVSEPRARACIPL